MRRIGSLVVFSALCAVAAEAAGQADLRRLLRQRGSDVKKEKVGRGAKTNLGRAALVTDGDFVMPFIANGDGLRTRIRLLNMENKAVDLELFFIDDDGFDAPVDLRDLGTVENVRLRIPARGVTTVETNARGDDQVVWSFFDAGTNRIAAAVSVEIEGEDGLLGVSYPATHFEDYVTETFFDNTEGSETEISVINLDTRDSTIRVIVRDVDGRQIHTSTRDVAGFGAAGFVPADAVRAARGARGSVEFQQSDSSKAGVAVVAVQFFDSGAINIFPGFSVLE
ncbi:MAG: hypothetical protein JNL62_08310 [Bryobacterales bacterium]|nr:hypothetical protein [Bryobacterales bacterium]